MEKQNIEMFGVYGLFDDIKYFQGDFMACMLYIFRHTEDNTEDRDIYVKFLKENNKTIIIADKYKIHKIG